MKPGPVRRMNGRSVEAPHARVRETRSGRRGGKYSASLALSQCNKSKLCVAISLIVFSVTCASCRGSNSDFPVAALYVWSVIFSQTITWCTDLRDLVVG